MPQARSSGSGSTSSRSSRSSSSGKSTSGRSQAKRSTSSAKRSTSAKSSSASRSSGASRSRAKSTSSGSASSKNAAEQRLDQVAQRVRKLNERIIEASKEAGDTTLTSYEKALKAIASTLERGPGSSEVDWISNLATAQAKFIRDVTTAWTNAARGVLNK